MQLPEEKQKKIFIIIKAFIAKTKAFIES